jgi:hypothetical protein
MIPIPPSKDRYTWDLSIRMTSFGWIKINQRTYAAADPVTSERRCNSKEVDVHMLAQRQNIHNLSVLTALANNKLFK